MFQFLLSPYFSIPCENSDFFVLYIDEVILQRTGATDYYFTHDYRYSVTSLTNLAGNIVESYDYKVYGERTASVSGLTDVGYTGQRHDSETGLMYFKNRYYSTSMGQFVTRDPKKYIDGMSMYLGYFGGNGADKYGLEDDLNYSSEIEELEKKIKKLKVISLGDEHLFAKMNYNITTVEIKYDCNDRKSKDEVLDRIYKKLETFSEYNSKNNDVAKGDIEGDNLILSTKPALSRGLSWTIGMNDEPFAVRLFKNKKERWIKAVTVNKHPLVGIRKWEVRELNRSTFTVEVSTEAFERNRNFVGSLGTYFPTLNIGSKDPLFRDLNPDALVKSLWTTYLQNIADSEVKLGGIISKVPEFISQTGIKGLDDNPLIDDAIKLVQKEQKEELKKLEGELDFWKTARRHRYLLETKSNWSAEEIENAMDEMIREHFNE